MRKAGGYWKRPTSRMYAYNLDLGEHYYYPMTYYLDSERGSRGETPGALTYSERLARRWLQGRSYGEQQMTRASSMTRAASLTRDASPGVFASSENYLESEMAKRSAFASRARSEVPEFRARTPPYEPERDMNNVMAFAGYKQALLDSSHQLKRESMARQTSNVSKQESEAVSVHRAARQAKQVQQTSAQTSQQVQQQKTQYRRQISDDICKKVADVHMMPWAVGQELNEAQSASARARARIAELERELEDITKKAMTTSMHARKTASQLAQEAMKEEEAMASSYKKSRKVMIESSSKGAH